MKWIGTICLNISFVIYIIVYIPQILHNHKAHNIAQLSITLHCLLYASYVFDLFYGFSRHLPWQYKTVSIIGLSLLIIQHLQLLKFYINQNQIVKISCFILLLILQIVFTCYFFIVAHSAVNASMTILFGSISRSCGLLYCVPQIIKNHALKSTKALSVHFTALNLFVSILDTISSWCLDWGWPNKLAAPINCFIMLILLGQARIYNISKYPKLVQGLQIRHNF